MNAARSGRVREGGPRECLAPVAYGAIVFFAACGAMSGEDAKPEPAEFRLALKAPVDEMKRALAERAVFDAVEVVLETKANAIVLRRAGPAFGADDWLAGQLRGLDESLALAANLRALTDEELVAKFDKLCSVPPVDWVFAREERDPVLLEIVRRGGDTWRDRMRERLAKLEEWRQAADEKRGTASWSARDLELLTALRRVEGKRDPVQMEVGEAAPCRYPDLPAVELRMVNRDERTVTMTRGGDYRSGREIRYHVEARDTNGRLLPSFEWNQGGMGGGMYAREQIATGAGLGTRLPLASFVAELGPGEYSVRIHYSDSAAIADPDGFVAHVTVRSDPFKITILPRLVETTAAAQARFAALAEALPDAGPVHVLQGEYGEWAHEFVAPGSAAGKLAAAGWEAVPALVRFVARADVSPMRRAWAFAVLHGITGRLYPGGTNLIGDHETHFGGMRGVTGGGFTGASRSVTTARPQSIDPLAQDAHARAWAKVAATIELRETK